MDYAVSEISFKGCAKSRIGYSQLVPICLINDVHDSRGTMKPARCPEPYHINQPCQTQYHNQSSNREGFVYQSLNIIYTIFTVSKSISKLLFMIHARLSRPDGAIVVLPDFVRPLGNLEACSIKVSV